jgi:hypothetical protein
LGRLRVRRPKLSQHALAGASSASNPHRRKLHEWRPGPNFAYRSAAGHARQRFKSAAKGYGIERRVLLLHGPVGSSKSTIARLLKKGLEHYTATDEGALYTLGWKTTRAGPIHWCPMHEEPLHLIPSHSGESRAAQLNEGRDPRRRLPGPITGDLAPTAGSCTAAAARSTTATGRG